MTDTTMTDEPAAVVDADVAELATLLIDEVSAFLADRGGRLTAVQIGDALGCLLFVGAEMLETCPGCRRRYIQTVQRHARDLELDGDDAPAADHVH
jgi:hypothetical protein